MGEVEDFRGACCAGDGGEFGEHYGADGGPVDGADACVRISCCERADYDVDARRHRVGNFGWGWWSAGAGKWSFGSRWKIVNVCAISGCALSRSHEEV